MKTNIKNLAAFLATSIWADGEYDEAAAAELKAKFCAALDNDINTSLAVTALYDVLKAKNFAEADRIRDELKAAGIEVTDIPNGAKYKKA